jgi:hypothetical protein
MDRRPIRWGAAAALAALGSLLLLPGTALAATVTVNPASVAPGGTFDVTVTCTGQATSATLSGTSFGGPSQIPLAPAAGAVTPGAFGAVVTVPTSTLPGTYDLSVTCSDGDSGLGTLIVAPSGTNAGEGPRGVHPATLAGGVALLVLGGAGAAVLARRGRGRTPA